MSQKIVSLDSQILNAVQKCARFLQNAFVLNLQTEVKEEALERGDLMHKMLEIYYSIKGNCIRWESEIFTDISPLEVQMLSNHPDIVKFCIGRGNHFASKMNLDPSEADEVIFQFSEYCKFYEHDEWRPLAVEEVGSKVLYEDEVVKIIYNFKIDLVAEKGAVRAPWDHKTGKRRQEPSSLSNQFLGYSWALGIPHVVINKIGFQKTLKPGERFQRFVLPIEEARITEWVSNTIWWARMLDYFIESNTFPMNLTSCDKYAGCIYSSLCESGPDSRQWKMDRDYKIGIAWDVAKILEVEK